MKRFGKGFTLSVLAAIVVALSATVSADVKTQEKSLVKFGGALGKMVGIFGGKAAREGMVSTVALKGQRRARTTDTHTEIVDLAEEKIYHVDRDDKTYTVTTFAELRQQLEDAQRRAKEQADDQAQKSDGKPADAGEKREVEIDFDMKETGQKKAISGYDTHQVIMTITVREKGKTLEQSGGLVLTADMWLGPEIPEMKEIAEFELRYAQKLYSGLAGTESAQQFAAALATNPGMKDAMNRLQKEKVNLNGTPLSTIVTMDNVRTKEQMAAAESEGSNDKASTGGLLGGFARKMARKKNDESKADAGAQNRSTFMTMTTDVLKIEPNASESDVAIPAGFRQKGK